jgi:putative DNA primase/helicase
MARIRPLSVHVPADAVLSMDATTRASFDAYLERLHDALVDNLEGLFDELLSERRSYRSGVNLYWRGRSGNSVVTVAHKGRNLGAWHDKSEDIGARYPLQAVRHFLGLDFRAALDWAADHCNLPRFDAKAVRRESAEKLAKEQAEREKKRAEKAAKAAEEEAKKSAADAATVASIVARTKPIAGTPGEVYLRETRRIEAKSWPDSVRWSDADKALVFLVTDAKGAVVGVQFVAVTPEGRKDADRYGKAGAKLSRGPIGRGSVKFPSLAAGPVVFCEGPETGLSVWIATGFEVRVVLGASGFRRVINEAPRDRKIILARDDDATNKQAYRSATAGLFQLANAGFDALDAWPFEERRQTGADFNDLLQEEGAAAVRARIAEAMADQVSIARIEHPIEHAEKMVERAVDDFFATLDGAMLLRPETGVGKTQAAIGRGVPFVAGLRAAGDQKALVILAPEHRLTGELQERVKTEISARDLSLQVATWRGRGALKPNAKHDKDRMCETPDLVRAAEELCVDVEEEVCGPCKHNPKNGGNCQYKLQAGLDADIWIGSHQLMFREPPKPIKRRGIAALIVDEDPLSAGIRAPFELPIQALEAMALPRDEDDRFELLDARHRLATCLQDAPEGFLHRSALAIDFATADAAVGLEWKRKVDRKAERDWKRRDKNKTLSKAVALWRAVAELAEWRGADGNDRISGFVEVALRRKDDVKVVRVSHRAAIHDAWKVATLIMSATPVSVRGLRQFWPGLRDLPRIIIAAPHQHIHQVVDRSYSLSWLAPPPKRKEAAVDEDGVILPADAARARTTARNRRDVAAAILRLHRRNGGKTLIVANKAVAQSPELARLAGLYSGDREIMLWHYGSMTGRDAAKDVRTVVVIGRPLGAPHAYETMAATLTGRGVERLAGETRAAGWYRRERSYRLHRVDGGKVVKVPCEVDAHPDAMVEELRHGECVGAVIQAIGRARGSRRRAETPVDVVVMTDVALPVPVDEFLTAEQLEPTLADLQLAAGGVAFEGGASAAAGYSDIWGSADAFRSDLKRETAEQVFKSSVSFPYKYSLYENDTKLSKLRVFSFQLAGNGQKRQVAVYDPELCADPRVFIETKVGAIARLDTITPPADAAADASPAPLDAPPALEPSPAPPWRPRPAPHQPDPAPATAATDPSPRPSPDPSLPDRAATACVTTRVVGAESPDAPPRRSSTCATM